MTNANSEEAMLRSLMAMASIVEARDPYTGGHLWRVAQLAKLAGRRMGLAGDELFRLTVGAYLHDLGKVGIPDRILLKEGPLTDDEFTVMKTHTLIGRDLLCVHPIGELVVDVVTHHHERLDGLGYPDGLGGTGLRAEPRIVGLVDAFDALTSVRPYRTGMEMGAALGILDDARGKHFDPEVVEALMGLYRDESLHHIVGHSHEGRALVGCPMCGPVIALARDAAEGDVVLCKACRGRFRLREADDGGFEAKATGEHASEIEIRPAPDIESVESVLAVAGE